ncbi:acyl-CoA dehydrogenase [Kutzneria chonburiensis]|uniref:Acyl-CoA dehydrogenase family protein n=1 Tax=Kutzneria chonburiensis TaxID=1483604 RepID=A0ABV6MP11_9PSEU|nr:acyl-CoA dehydrogenase [Kutzneria chonburiensis]
MSMVIDDGGRQLRAAVLAAGPAWPDLAALGLFGLALPEAVGGLGNPVADLAVAVEAAAELLAPGPVLSTLTAAVALARVPDHPLAAKLLPGIADGSVAVAVHCGPVALGESGPMLVKDGDDWALADAVIDPADPVDLGRPLGFPQVDPIADDQRLGPLPVADIFATLAAAEAAGIADWCLRTAVEYAKIRTQFGQPIGSFQAVKHLCVEMLCRSERAAAVAWDAARAYDQEPAEFPLAAATAAAIAVDAAVDNANDCIQVLGGIGFTWEHDAHRYLRRAISTRQLLGGTARWRRRVAELAKAGHRRTLTLAIDADRTQVRQAVEVIASADDQRKQLADSGFLAPHWPRPYGLDAGPTEQLIIDEELDRAGVQRPDLVIGWWAVPTILAHGTDQQREQFAGPTLRGEITWCQLFSEPGAGSDLASLRTKAERVEGGWKLTGQKVWTSLARTADWAICLARTNPDVPKHRGITYFLVDMRTSGIDIRPLREITGDAVFNEVFLDGVFVPDDHVVGAVDGGWKLARTTLANERVAMSRGSSLGEEVERVLSTAEPSERLGGLVADGLAMSLLDLRTTLRKLADLDPGAASSVRKLVGVRHRQNVAETALDLDGPLGAVTGERSREFLMTRCLSIAGGTEQVLLTLAGERLLGLPRA